MRVTPQAHRDALIRTAALIENARLLHERTRDILHAARNTRHHAGLLRQWSRRARRAPRPSCGSG